MEMLIEKIRGQLDPIMIESEIGKIRDIKLDMNDIEGVIEGIKSELNVWEKLNPFSQSEEKKELQYHKGELKFYKKEYKVITDHLRAEIRTIIESTPSLRMKATVSEMSKTLDNLRAKLRMRQNQRGPSNHRAREIRKLEEQIQSLHFLMENEFGYKAGNLSETEMIEIVLREILRSVDR